MKIEVMSLNVSTNIWRIFGDSLMTYCAFWGSYKLNPANVHILRIKPYFMRLNNDACNACGTAPSII